MRDFANRYANDPGGFARGVARWLVLGAVLLLAPAAGWLAWSAQRAPAPDRAPYGLVPDFPLTPIFDYPLGIAAGPDGRLYVADKHYHKIQAFAPDGTFLREWGWPRRGKGEDISQFDRPSALAVGPDGTVYVADVNNNRIQAFDADGNFLRMWGEEDCRTVPRPAGRFCFLEGVSVGADGAVYVLDSWNHRVQVFSPEGRFLRMWGRNGGDGTPGGGDGEFRKPMYGVAVAPTGPGGAEEVYVADKENHRVQVFDTSGRFLRRWGGEDCRPPAGDGRFCYPAGIAVGRTGAGGAYEVYVTDAGNNRIQVFTPAGAFLRKWGKDGGTGAAGAGMGEFNDLHSVAIVGDRLFIADSGNNRIHSFTPQGVFLSGWGSGYGDGPAMFYEVRGTAVDRDGNLYVVDGQNGRVQVFDAGGRFLRQWGGTDCWSRPRPAGKFCGPDGIQVDREGRVYVVDTLNHRVQVFDSTGRFLAKWGRNGGDGTAGAGDGEFNRPADVAVDERGHVYITDAGNNRIQAFARGADGRYAFARKWGGAGAEPGYFRSPQGVAVGPDRSIYVADAGNHRLQVFRVSRRRVSLVRQIGGAGAAPGRFRNPRAVRLDAAGNVYVADAGNHRVQKLTADGGEVLALWGAVGESPGRFAGGDSPHGLAVTANGDEVYVTDPGNDRVHRFRRNQPDVVPPQVTHEVRCKVGWGGKCASEATVLLTADDAGSSASRVVSVRYRVDGGAWQEYEAPFVIQAEGVHVVTYYAVDNAGNRSSYGFATLRIASQP